MKRALLVVITCFSFSALAEVYKSVDKYGNVTYTDDPSTAERRGEQAEKVQVPPTNVVPGSRPMEIVEPESEPESRYPDFQVRIVSPENEATVPPGQRDLIVAAATQQPLTQDTQFAYYMDGQLLGKQRTNNYSIKEIIRGAHQLRVDVVNTEGKTLSSSDTVTVYVHRASVN